MSHHDQTLFVLTGCTAVGKTDLSLEWAESNDAEIVSCDSLLFYRGMDIGTAKPSLSERARVPHHLIDIKAASHQMDIAEYLHLAIAAIEEIRSRGKAVLITGGSGFYLKAFFSPVIDSIVVSEETRKRVAEIEATGGLDSMRQALEALDPDYRDYVDTENPRRVIRALERSMETGRSLRDMREAFDSQTNLLIESPKRLTILQRNRDELDLRIEQRAGKMLEDGLVEEVRRLRAAGFEANASGAGSIGYRETIAYLNGDYGLGELKETIARNTRRLAKKQRTWLRTQLPVGHVVDLSEGKSVSATSLFPVEPDL